MAIVVVIADATRLSPARAQFEARAFANIGERAVAIILKETTMRFMALGESFKAPAIYKKNVQPAVIVVVVERQAATGRFEQVFIFVHAAIDRFHIEARTFYDIDEADAERCAFDGRLWSRRRRSRLRVVAAFGRTNFLFLRGFLLWSLAGKRQKISKRKHQRCAAQRVKKFAPVSMQEKSSSATSGRRHGPRH